MKKILTVVATLIALAGAYFALDKAGTNTDGFKGISAHLTEVCTGDIQDQKLIMLCAKYYGALQTQQYLDLTGTSLDTGMIQYAQSVIKANLLDLVTLVGDKYGCESNYMSGTVSCPDQIQAQ